MRTYRKIPKHIKLAFLGIVGLALSGCGDGSQQANKPATAPIGDTPAVRLSYRYEGDVPAPTIDAAKPGEDRNVAIQGDFDATRPQEVLDRTITSPDKKRVAAVYHHVSDITSEYRLDMYSPDGKLLHKMTSDTMAVHFPDTISWAPDSSNIAFVAMLRVAPPLGVTTTAPTPPPIGNTAAVPPDNTNEAVDNANAAVPAQTAPTPAAPTGILTFRSEQIYMANADGALVKPLTLNEGIIYFYYAWSPDSSSLVALATTVREWKYMEIVSGSKGEQMIPQGRPRIVEKNGRERRLDDNLTAVRPVWSPDSTKVAAAFGNQIRVYDAAGVNPTQAAISLRNQLLISSQNYDREQQRILQTANTGESGQATPEPTVEQVSTLPDEKLLVSYNPIVEIAWTAEDLLYLKTAYLRKMKNDADSVMSFARWHRLFLSVQAANTPK